MRRLAAAFVAAFLALGIFGALAPSASAANDVRPELRPQILGQPEEGNLLGSYCGAWEFTPVFCELEWVSFRDGKRIVVGRNPVYLVRSNDTNIRLRVVVYDALGNKYNANSVLVPIIR